jgi:hypothetical protein
MGCLLFLTTLDAKKPTLLVECGLSGHHRTVPDFKMVEAASIELDGYHADIFSLFLRFNIFYPQFYPYREVA